MVPRLILTAASLARPRSQPVPASKPGRVVVARIIATFVTLSPSTTMARRRTTSAARPVRAAQLLRESTLVLPQVQAAAMANVKLRDAPIQHIPQVITARWLTRL